MKKIQYIPANTIGTNYLEEPKGLIIFEDEGLRLFEMGIAEKFDFANSKETDGNVVCDLYEEKYFDASFFPKRDLYGSRLKYNSFKSEFGEVIERVGHYNLIICDKFGNKVQSIFLESESKALEILEAYSKWILLTNDK